MDNVECDGNGWHPYTLGISSACAKIGSSGGDLTVRNSNIHDNNWVGLWGDFCGANHANNCTWLLENNSMNHNGFAAVEWEISGGYNAGDLLTMHGNTIQNNGWNTATGATTAAGVTIDGGLNVDLGPTNTFGGNQYGLNPGIGCCHAVYALTDARSPFPISNVSIHDNTLNGDVLIGCTLTGVTCSNNI
jgi:hypothetical protein